MSNSVSSLWKTTNVAQALDKVLHTLLGEVKPLVIPYGTNRDALWALDSPWLKKQLADATKNGVVLIWDGSVSSAAYAGRISTAEYLNPLTWSLCALRRFPHLQVTVLDCDAAEHSKGKFYQVVRTLDPAQLPFRLLTHPCHCVADYLSFLQKHRTVVESTTVTDLLTHQVRALLTERGRESNHHALANIVGPLILTEKRRLEDGRSSQHALLSLFREVGLFGSVNAPGLHATLTESGQGVEPDVSPPRLFGDQPVRLLLVDDQFDQGWDEWVASMVTGEPACSIEKTATPDVLVQAINEGLAKEGTDVDCRFRLRFPSLQALAAPTEGSGAQSKVSQARTNFISLSDLTAEVQEPPSEQQDAETILLLDLRLFSLRAAMDEADFVRAKLLPLCRRFVAYGDSSPTKRDVRLAWAGFSSDELKASDEWCENPRRETDAYLHVLSLLPRLLALVDFSLPIVLFSSTGQRRIIELLKPYGNIITDFEKPRFTGLESANLVAATECAFRTALTKAENLLAARRRCRRVLSAPENSTKAPTDTQAVPQQARSLIRYVELFLDESDWTQDSWFSLGGCFAVFEAEDFLQATAKADRFDDWLVQQGIRYFDGRGVGVTPRDVGLRTKGNNLLPRIQEYRAHPDAPVHLGLVRLRIERGVERDSKGPLFDVHNADNRYHLALKTLLESFLCDSIPALAGNVPPEEVVISVFPGTRVVYIDPRYQDPVMIKFGLKRLGNTNLFFSFDRSQVYPIVADILDAHNLARKTFRLVGVQLPYKEGNITLPEYFRCTQCSKAVFLKRDDTIPANCPKCGAASPAWRTDYRALHYLADEVLTEFPERGAVHQYDALFGERLVPGEFDEVLDRHLDATLAASRHLDADNLVDAIAAFEPPPSDTGTKPRISLWLRKRMLLKLLYMTGDDFIRLSRRVAEDHLRRNQSPRVQGARPRVQQRKHTPCEALPSSPGHPSNPRPPAPSARSRVVLDDDCDALKRKALPLSIERVNAIGSSKWKVKRFKNPYVYRDSGESWHEKPGFDVRRTKNGKVNVFADLSVVNESELNGFLDPDESLFSPHGTPGGWPLELDTRGARDCSANSTLSKSIAPSSGRCSGLADASHRTDNGDATHE